MQVCVESFFFFVYRPKKTKTTGGFCGVYFSGKHQASVLFSYFSSVLQHFPSPGRLFLAVEQMIHFCLVLNVWVFFAADFESWRGQKCSG